MINIFFFMFSPSLGVPLEHSTNATKVNKKSPFGQSFFIYFFPRDLIHFVQANILFPANPLKFLFVVLAGTITHCRLGFILLLVEGLYLEISL